MRGLTTAMKLSRFFAALVFLALVPPGARAGDEGETRIDMSAGIRAVFHKDVGAKIEVANDELENVPVLTVTIPPEGEFERYFGTVRMPIPNPTLGGYTVIFEARFEPGENQVEMRVYDYSKKEAVEVGPRKQIRMGSDWKEFVFDFSFDREGAIPTVTWTELARKGKTFSLRNVRLLRY